MPLLRRRTHSATTTQTADSGTVPGQRATPEGTRSPDTAAGYRQTEDRQAGAQAYGESVESRRAPRRYYGMAGTLMTLSGILTFFIGLTGVIRGLFFSNVPNYPFYFSVRGRGVTLLVIGIVAFVVGLGLLLHMRRARHVATVVAVVSAVANFMFLPFYPFWSIVVLILDVIVIWELTRERDGRGFVRLPAEPAFSRPRPTNVMAE